MKIKAEKGETTIYINDNVVCLPSAFKSGLIVQERFVVLFYKEYSKSNIFAFDEQGQKIWEVQENPFRNRDTGYELIDLAFSENNISYNSFLAMVGETWFKIDGSTGKVLMSFGDHQKTVYYNKPNNWFEKILRMFR